MNLSSERLARVLVLAAVVAVPAASAQTDSTAPSPVATRPVAAPAPAELRIEGDVIRLPLEQAVELALRRNLGLVVERFSREQARQGIFQNLGIYDLLAAADVRHTDSRIPTASSLEASQFEEDRADLSLTQLLPSGAVASFAWNNRRTESNSQFAAINPSYRSSPTFSLTQPLLRDFGRLTTERNLMIARTNDSISRETFETQVATTIQQTENAYWDLVEAREQLKVAEESLALTRELHDQNRIRVEVGTLAPLELVQSEAGIATREEEIIRSRSRVGDAEDELRRLLALDQGELWSKSIDPETSPEREPLTLELEESIAAALRERPELNSQRLVIETARIESEYFRGQRKPQLDAIASYGWGGVGGTLLVDPVTGQPLARPLAGGFGDALDQIRGLDFPSWSVGLTFSMPIQNRAARAQSTIADLELEQSQATLKDLEQTVITEVRRAARAVETAREVIVSAAVSSRLAEKNLEAERKRYENGMSTSFQILEIQEDLTAARSREVTAVTGYRRALAEFYRAIGRLLEENGVALDDEPAAI